MGIEKFLQGKRLSTAVLLVCLCMVTQVYADLREYQIKTAFIVKIVEFVKWPKTVIVGKSTAEESPPRLNFCVARPRGLSSDKQERILKDGRIEEHFNLLHTENYSDCNIVYIPAYSNEILSQILEQLKKTANVLTISDNPGYARKGVMINFLNRNQRIAFEINRNVMNAHGLDISASVLKLADIIN